MTFSVKTMEVSSTDTPVILGECSFTPSQGTYIWWVAAAGVNTANFEHF